MNSEQTIDDSAVRGDEIHEECGIVAVWDAKPYTGGDTAAHDDAARSAFYALFSLQHRGQEGSGIAVSNGRHIRVHKAEGLVSGAFNEQIIASLQGNAAIGHTRYSTTGGASLKNIQPFYIETRHGPVAIAHNGNLINAGALRKKLLHKGVGLSSTSDTEVMLMMLASADGNTWPERIAACMAEWEGAFSVAILTREALYVARDPWGFRPLCVGRFNGSLSIAASESCALLTLGCSHASDVAPGQIVELRDDGPIPCGGIAPSARQASCIFEYIYFARPDSVWNGISVHSMRIACGEILAKKSPAAADVVIAVPDSSRSAAIGFSQGAQLPYDEGFAKNRYIGRTFIQPTQKLRAQGVALKFNTIPSTVCAKRVVLVDDSIVRGTTIGPLIKMLRDAGAAEVHVRIACPPIRYQCYMGVDMGPSENLIAHKKSVDEIRVHIGADSLAFLHLDDMLAALHTSGSANTTEKSAFCTACFSGDYPIDVSRASGKDGFE